VTRKRLLAAILLGATLLLAPSAGAKVFEPGDLRVCNASRCLPIMDEPTLAALSSFYYTGPRRPRVAPDVRLGAPAYDLRSPNGYVTGIVAGAKLDRFLSYGVHLGWFRRGRWHRVPELAARELKSLTRGLTPLRVTRGSLARSR
jgi:hypothetical protein